MKNTYRTKHVRLIVAVMLVAFATLALPFSAMAYTPAEGAKILNVVTVSYEDTAGTSQTANASSLVTVTLAPAALTVSGPPESGVPGDSGGYDCPPTVDSGETASVMNAISANANGDDSYTIDFSGITPADVANQSVTFSIYNSSGGLDYTASTSEAITLGSAITVGVKTGTDDTLLFDGGVDLETIFDVGDIVVVKESGSPVDYVVVSRTNGTAVSHDNPGGVDHADTGNTNNATAYGELQLAAFQVTINTVTYGSNTTPAFVPATPAPAAGTVVGEMVLVEINVTADSTSQTVDGTVDFNFDTTNSNNDDTSDACQTTFNKAAALVIKKEVSLDNSTFAATASAAPGADLYYRVTVSNPSSSDAEEVVVTDNVPLYTSLYNSAGNFASINYNTAGSGYGGAFNITLGIDATESADEGAGNADGSAAGDTMSFFLGAGNNGATETGGTMGGGDSAIIEYRVTID